LGKHRLIPHPDTPPASIEAVEVEIVMTGRDDARFHFAVRGRDLLLPDRASPERADGLWETTCFELFLRPAASRAYFEFNFSPSGRWAAYAFDSHREGRRAMALAVAPFIDRDPPIEPEVGGPLHVIEGGVDLSDLPGEALRMGLCAVIEETSGRKSYWALAHPPGPPDFHHEDGFTLELPAAA
jgi:hypothetical protein